MTKEESKSELAWAILFIILFVGNMFLVAFGFISQGIYTHIMVFGIGFMFHECFKTK